MRHLVLRLAALAPLGLTVVVVNWLADPGNLFGPDEVESRVAEQLWAGQTVSIGFGLDEMRLQQLRAENRRRRPDLLILGSSRAMTLSSAAFPSRDVVNSSVSSGSLEDYLALYELYVELGMRPKGVLLAVDPWALTGGLQNASVALEAQLQQARARLHMGTGPGYGSLPAVTARSRWWLLLSPAYFQASLPVLMGGRPARRRTALEPDGGAQQVDDGVMYPDGSRQWPAEIVRRGPQEVSRRAAAFAAQRPTFVRDPPDPRRERLLSAFLGLMLRDGTDVALWLAPYHPTAWEALGKGEHGATLGETEGAIRSVCARHGVAVLGSYDPAGAGVAPEAFVDEHHLRRVFADDLLARALTATDGRRPPPRRP
jgi:hypothetical protein